MHSSARILVLLNGLLSPIYMGRLNRFRIQIKLNQIRVIALIQIVNQFISKPVYTNVNRFTYKPFNVTHLWMWVEPR